MKFYTIKINGKHYDLPKSMPVPQIGNMVFIDDKSGKVLNVLYHVVNGKIHTINILTDES